KGERTRGAMSAGDAGAGCAVDLAPGVLYAAGRHERTVTGLQADGCHPAAADERRRYLLNSSRSPNDGDRRRRHGSGRRPRPVGAVDRLAGGAGREGVEGLEVGPPVPLLLAGALRQDALEAARQLQEALHLALLVGERRPPTVAVRSLDPNHRVVDGVGAADPGEGGRVEA